MKLIIFDTETTGLTKEWKISPEDKQNNWPHIVSIAWIVLDSDTNLIVSQKSYIIRPIDWIIPAESTAIHSVAHSFAVNYGSPLEDVLKEFFDTQCDMYVAHNMNFDENVIRAAIKWDLKDSTIKFNKPLACSMKIGTGLCKMPSKFGRGYKPPKLSELYEHVFHTKPNTTQLHSAMYDAKILCDIIKSCDTIRSSLGLGVTNIITTNESPRIKSSILYI